MENIGNCNATLWLAFFSISRLEACSTLATIAP
jgi:hypothetical protein